jgi:hypothetical protein
MALRSHARPLSAAGAGRVVAFWSGVGCPAGAGGGQGLAVFGQRVT